MSYIRTFCETYDFDAEAIDSLEHDYEILLKNEAAYIKWLEQGGTVGEGFGFFLYRE